MRRNASSSPDSAEPGEPEAYAITQAQAAHSEGVDSRMRRYLLQMAIRVVCIVLAVLVDGWVRWAAVAGAMVLPWVAVVLANGSDRAEVRDVSFYTDPEPAALPSPPEETQSATDGTAPHPDDASEFPEEAASSDGPAGARQEEDVIEGEFTEGPARGGRGGQSWT